MSNIFDSLVTKPQVSNCQQQGQAIIKIPFVCGCCSIWSTPGTPDRRTREWCRKHGGRSLHLCSGWRWGHYPRRKGWGRAATLPAPSRWPTTPPVWASGSHSKWYSAEEKLGWLFCISDSGGFIWVACLRGTDLDIICDENFAQVKYLKHGSCVVVANAVAFQHIFGGGHLPSQPALAKGRVEGEHVGEMTWLTAATAFIFFHPFSDRLHLPLLAICSWKQSLKKKKKEIEVRKKHVQAKSVATKHETIKYLKAFYAPKLFILLNFTTMFFLLSYK